MNDSFSADPTQHIRLQGALNPEEPPSETHSPKEPSTDLNEPPSALKKTLKTMGWTLLALFSLTLFTLLKLPEDRVKNFIQGTVASYLSRQNIGFSAAKGHISIFMGISYVMKDITLTLPPPASPVRIEEASVSPSLLPLLIGRRGGRVDLKPSGKDPGSLSLSFSMKKDEMNLSYDASAIDIGKLGLLALALDVKGSAILSGKGEVSGDFNNPSSWTGHIQLDMSKLQLDAQTIQRFSVPPVRISEGKVDLEIQQGKATIKTLQLGKLASDDLKLKGTGTATLARQLYQTQVNTKMEFSLSSSFLKSLTLLDLILSPGKQPDGSYAFLLTGPIYSINSAPVSQGSK